jgi:hypothetical protein
MPCQGYAVRCIARLQICYSCCHSSFPKPKSDDFDLDEVFAEYFMSEPEELAAYTSSMVNCDGATHEKAMDQVGITVMDHWKPTPSPGNSFCLAMGGKKSVFVADAAQQENGDAADAEYQSPPTKKFKQGAASSLAADAPSQFEHPGWHIMMNEYQQMLNQHQHQVVANQQHTQQHLQQVQQHDVQQVQHNIVHQAQVNASEPLPVGVGIHFGDVGDVVPVAMQSAPCAQMSQSHYTMEGTVEGSGSGATKDYAVAEFCQKQKNREYAREFRVRTKSTFESLREELASLKLQNQGLRAVVKVYIPKHAKQIIADCSCADADDIESATGGEQQDLVKSDLILSSNRAPTPNPLLDYP